MWSANKELNKQAIWKDKRCSICNRKYPATILNIEGYLHHNGALVCLDTKVCHRYIKKLKRKKNNP